MPSSFDHCKECAFSAVEAGDRATVAVEHSINMDVIYGRTRIPAEMKSMIDEARLAASIECARMVVNGECSIYSIEGNHLVEKEE